MIEILVLKAITKIEDSTNKFNYKLNIVEKSVKDLEDRSIEDNQTTAEYLRNQSFMIKFQKPRF